MNNIEEIKKEIEIVKGKISQNAYPGEWRKGQAVFNLSHDSTILRKYTEILRATQFDCFYIDSKIDGFFNEILTLAENDK